MLNRVMRSHILAVFRKDSECLLEGFQIFFLLCNIVYIIFLFCSCNIEMVYMTTVEFSFLKKCLER